MQDVLRRHESILVPQIVASSDAHFEKFEPHFSVMHERSAESHVFAPADTVAVRPTISSDADFAAINSRWARTLSAKDVPDVSDDADNPKNDEK